MTFRLSSLPAPASVDVPPALAAAYQERATLPASTVCRLLAIDPKTLRQHVRAGNIRYVLKGFGEKRPRREFMLSDVMGFLDKRRREECRSIGARTPRSTGASSASTVTDFATLRARLNAGRLSSRNGA